MSNYFTEFQKVSKTDWEAKIVADLKGKNQDTLRIKDVIEEIDLSGYQHIEDIVHESEIPGNFPYSRGMNKADNSWNNGVLIEIEDEIIANKKALKSLNSGADLLVFKAIKSKTNWKVVLDQIEFEHIKTQFIVRSPDELNELKNTAKLERNEIGFNIDFLEEQWSDASFQKVANLFKDKQQQFCSINGFKLQQSGATTWQEVAFSLSAGHEYLVKLMQMGFTIDQAAGCISFKIGIGSNYLYEIAKIRSLKKLWSKIVNAYSPEHGCSHNCPITAVIGHMNKSLNDPYTNVLRQTTEVMSAVNAGVDGVVVLPYDLLSCNGPSELAERLALNISSILKQESYLDKVIDPIGGSYSLEKLTEFIGEKSWGAFKILDAGGGVFDKQVLNNLLAEIVSKRSQRIKQFSEGNSILIGINKYRVGDKADKKWEEANVYLGMKQLIFEIEHKTTAV
jgi:methylmalonyl-CoA mutase